MIHTYAGTTIRFEIEYKNRTSIGMTIDSYGIIEVQAPKKTPDERMLHVLEENWELAKINRGE